MLAGLFLHCGIIARNNQHGYYDWHCRLPAKADDDGVAACRLF